MHPMRRPSPRVVRALALSLLALVVLFLFVGLAPEALAQHSGGSFGGSHFGGGGGGYGGGGGSYGGGGYSGGYSGSYHGGGAGIFVLALEHPVIFGVFVLVFLAVRLANGRRFGDRLPGPEARAWMYIDVTAVRIAVDGSAREFIQAELAKVSRGSTQSRAALLLSLRRVVHILRKCDAAWIYAGASNFRPMSAPVGEAAFRRLANEARSKFQYELVRNADGSFVESKGPAFQAREHEGAGVALITIVVAAKREIVDFDASSRESILSVLGDLDRLTADHLVALEVAWSPADPNDRISTATLEAIHPDLKKLPGALGGRVDCKYCKGPYAAELPTCPHCGAPAESSKPARG
jgi:uncharacterized membrane protein